MVKKTIVVLYILAIIAVIGQKDALLEWMRQDDLSQLPLTIAAAAMLAFIPAVPFGLVGGIIGAKYGSVIGACINLAASSAAAALMFWSARYIAAERGRAALQRFRTIERFTRMYERNPFMAVMIARVIPIIPAQAVNIYSAIGKVPFRTFIIATVIGKLPAMFVFAFIGEQIRYASQIAWVAGIYGVFFTCGLFVVPVVAVDQPILAPMMKEAGQV